MVPSTLDKHELVFWWTLSPPWPLEGTFMVARMLCRSLSWMGWAGLADPAA